MNYLSNIVLRSVASETLPAVQPATSLTAGWSMPALHYSSPLGETLGAPNLQSGSAPELSISASTSELRDSVPANAELNRSRFVKQQASSTEGMSGIESFPQDTLQTVFGGHGQPESDQTVLPNKSRQNDEVLIKETTDSASEIIQPIQDRFIQRNSIDSNFSELEVNPSSSDSISGPTPQMPTTSESQISAVSQNSARAVNSMKERTDSASEIIQPIQDHFIQRNSIDSDLSELEVNPSPSDSISGPILQMPATSESQISAVSQNSARDLNSMKERTDSASEIIQPIQDHFIQKNSIDSDLSELEVNPSSRDSIPRPTPQMSTTSDSQISVALGNSSREVNTENEPPMLVDEKNVLPVESTKRLSNDSTESLDADSLTNTDSDLIDFKSEVNRNSDLSVETTETKAQKRQVDSDLVNQIDDSSSVIPESRVPVAKVGEALQQTTQRISKVKKTDSRNQPVQPVLVREAIRSTITPAKIRQNALEHKVSVVQGANPRPVMAEVNRSKNHRPQDDLQPQVQVHIGTIEVRSSKSQEHKATESLPTPQPIGFDKYRSLREYSSFID